MSIDPEVSNWVLEFLFRQPLGDRVLNSLIRALPLPDDKPLLKKSILLKKLESDASRHSISESTLDALEELEEIEFGQGVEQVSDSMKRAYCSVAVECTAGVLSNGDDGRGNGDTGDQYRRFMFFQKVMNVWRMRIGPMENGGLGSDDLRIWKDTMEAAVWDDNVLESIKKKWEGVNAVEAVKDFVREERGKLAPSFLEVLADRMKGDEVSWGTLGMGSFDQRAGKEAPLDNSVLNKNVSDAVVSNEIRNEQFHPGKKHFVMDCEGLASRNSKTAKTVDLEKMTTGRSVSESIYGVVRENKCDDPVEANRVEASSNVAKDPEHHDLVEDNHVEAVPGSARETKCLDPVEEKHDEANLSNVGGTGNVQTVGCGAKKTIPKPRVMEPPTSAPTIERGDPINRPQDDPKASQAARQRVDPINRPQDDPKASQAARQRGDPINRPQDDPKASQAARHRSRSPRKNASPLKKPENKVQLRRRPKRWSLLEEDALRKGVEKYGKGNWKFILNLYHDVFQERTDVDLKDKWRNMTRYMS